MSFHIIKIEIDGSDKIPITRSISVKCPGLVDFFNLFLTDIDRLHHLPQSGIGEDKNRCPPAIGKIKRLNRHPVGLFDRGRSQNNISVIAVATPLDNLEVVTLFRTDVPQTWTDPLDINNDTGELCSGQIRDPFHLQADPGTGTGCQRP